MTDLDDWLGPWKYESGKVNAKLISARDGRDVIHLRVELGILQLETKGRPDGLQPHGFPTFFAYLRHLADQAGEDFTLDEEQCEAADQEFSQFYQRRVCWLMLHRFEDAITDADHTLAFMDFVKLHSPSEEYTSAHERFRGFVVFQRTQAASALQVEMKKPDQAIDAVRQGLDQLRGFFAENELEDEMEENGMVRHLRRVESALREQYKIGATLREQLEKAIAEEDYEAAARLRDEIRNQ